MCFIKKLMVIWFITVTNLVACSSQNSQESNLAIKQVGESKENVGISLNQNVITQVKINDQFQALTSGIAEHLDY